jgi:hypothetical protein
MLETPGQRTLDAGTTPIVVLKNDQGRVDREGPIVIDATYAIDGGNTGRTDELRAGCLMAKLDSGLWVPCKRTAVRTGTTGTVTALTVDDASFFKVGDVITVGADTGITVTAVDYTTHTLTIASTAVVDGEVVFATTPAGAKTARGILNNTVRLLSGEPFQTDQLDKTSTLLLAGYVDASVIQGDLTAIRADTGAKLGQFIWSDEH